MIAVFGVFSSQASANLLSDPGFENGGSAIVIKDGPWTWSGGANGDSFYDSTVTMSGAKAAKVVIWGGGGTDYAYFNEDFTGIDFSAPYLLNGNFLWNSADTLKDGSSAKLQVKWYNSLGNVIRVDESALFDNSATADTWHPLSIATAAAPQGRRRYLPLSPLLRAACIRLTARSGWTTCLLRRFPNRQACSCSAPAWLGFSVLGEGRRDSS